MTHGHRLSNDLRLAILNMARTLDVSHISKYTGCPRRTIFHILKCYRETGRVLHQSNGRLKGARRRLLAEDVEFLRGTIEFSPDLYIDELQRQLYQRRGVEVSDSTIWRTLRRLGFTLKKVTKAAMERNEAKRAAYRYEYGRRYTPEQTVFVDESSFDRRTAIRGRAWALSGQRAHRNVFFVRGRRYSMLPALSLDGVIHVKIIEGSFTAARFREFIEGLLDKMQPFPAPNSVIVMDNARIHKDPRIIDLIHARGMRVMFLPPYSPDYNPIELAFSSIKAFVKRERLLGTELDGEDDTYVYLHLIRAAYSISANHALGYYYHCGYV